MLIFVFAHTQLLLYKICNRLVDYSSDDEILFLDCMVDPLDELDQLTRDVYLPLLCINDSSTPMFGLHPDKLMDVLHRLMAYVTTTQGHSKVSEYPA